MADVQFKDELVPLKSLKVGSVVMYDELVWHINGFTENPSGELILVISRYIGIQPIKNKKRIHPANVYWNV